MNTRKILILFLSLMTVSIFFSIEAYSHWYEERVQKFVGEIDEQLDYMSLEERKMIRWGPSYEASKIIKEEIIKAKVKDPLILTPPASYGFKFVRGLSIVEPVTFYYYTGLKTTTRECKDVTKANYSITADPHSHQPLLTTMKHPDDLPNTLKEYESTPPPQQ